MELPLPYLLLWHKNIECSLTQKKNILGKQKQFEVFLDKNFSWPL